MNKDELEDFIVESSKKFMSTHDSDSIRYYLDNGQYQSAWNLIDKYDVVLREKFTACDETFDAMDDLKKLI